MPGGHRPSLGNKTSVTSMGTIAMSEARRNSKVKSARHTNNSSSEESGRKTTFSDSEESEEREDLEITMPVESEQETA